MEASVRAARQMPNSKAYFVYISLEKCSIIQQTTISLPTDPVYCIELTLIEHANSLTSPIILKNYLKNQDSQYWNWLIHRLEKLLIYWYFLKRHSLCCSLSAFYPFTSSSSGSITIPTPWRITTLTGIHSR